MGALITVAMVGLSSRPKTLSVSNRTAPCGVTVANSGGNEAVSTSHPLMCGVDGGGVGEGVWGR